MLGMSNRDRAEMAEIRNIAITAMGGISKHEAVCAERQGEIREQLKSVQKIIWTVAFGVIGTFCAAVVNMIMHFPPNH